MQPAPLPSASNAIIETSRQSGSDSNQNDATIAVLRSEIAELQLRIENRKKFIAAIPAAARLKTAKKRTIKTHFLAPEDWQYRGTETPAHALESLLYTSATGDTDSLKSILLMDDETREFASALFDLVPPDLKSNIGDVDQFVAMMTTDAVPLKEYRIPGVFKNDDPLTATIVLQAPKSGSEEITPFVNLTARRKSKTSPWQIIVPTEAIERYHQKLFGPLPPHETSPNPD